MSQNTKRTLLTETPSESQKTLLTDAITDAKKVREEALNETKSKREQALEKAQTAIDEAFNEINVGVIGEGETVTELELHELIEELDKQSDDPVIKDMKELITEAKDSPQSSKDRMYQDIHRKFWAYVKSRPERLAKGEMAPVSETDRVIKNFLSSRSEPLVTWLSHEGSTIVCALISVADSGMARVSINQLPDADKILVNSVLHKMTGNQYDSKSFIVSFDEYKNFVFETELSNRKDDVKFTMGNRVASIPPSESSKFGNIDVKVERKGKDVVIGDRIVVEKSKMQTLAQTGEPSSNGGWQREREKRQKVAGRNAYEIRADVLEMALDWIKHTKKSGTDENDVLQVAEAFYGFVEHK